MKLKEPFITLFLLALFLSCKNNENDIFYTQLYREDLVRIPLIKPYELLNQYEPDSNYFGTHGWNLSFRYNKFDGYIGHVNVSHVNVISNIIFGHGQDGRTGFPNYWFVIVPTEKSEKIFENENDWRSYIKSRGINTDEIFSVWSVYDQFRASHILPWYNPKKGIYP